MKPPPFCRIVVPLLFVALQVPHSAQAAALKAFPGAEGFGADSVGGRGGRVIQVTNLKDSGPGSLRDAVTAEGPRVVVFRVGGTVRLESKLVIDNDYLTIAGETAPGDGILIRGDLIRVNADHVIIRHLRIRTGAEGRDPGNTDGLFIRGNHVIVDQVSVSWATDENLPITHGHHVTVQWSIIAEGLCGVTRPDDENCHSKGAFFAYGADLVSFHHNLLANNQDRNPYGTSGRHEIVNNVIYNKAWGTYLAHPHTEYPAPQWNFLKNYLKNGPLFVAANDGQNKNGVVENFRNEGLRLMDGEVRAYVEGNLHSRRPDDRQPAYLTVVRENERAKLTDKPFSWGTRYSSETDARTAFKQVLERAGARMPRLDTVDQRILAEVNSGTEFLGTRGKLMRPGDLEWPTLKDGPPYPDEDRDGMADAWELKNGLNPKDPADGSKDNDGDGYTNLEEFLHSLTEAVLPSSTSTSR